MQSSTDDLDDLFQSTPNSIHKLYRFSGRGLDHGLVDPLDLFKPVTHFHQEISSPCNEWNGLEYMRYRKSIEYVSECTMWKNLSIGQSRLLFEMHRRFVPCLEAFLGDRIERLVEEALAYGIRFQPAENKLLNFKFSELIDAMLFKTRGHLLETCQKLPDSPIELILLFLRWKSCLASIESHSDEDTSIHVRLLPGTRSALKVETPLELYVVKQLDYISFKELDVLPREGHHLSIIPRYMYRHGKYEKGQPNNMEISYRLVTPLPWLVWNKEISGFRGVIPKLSERGGPSGRCGKAINVGREDLYDVVNLLRIELEATLIQRHSTSPLRLQRTIRTRLNLKVIPWCAKQFDHTHIDDLYRQSKYFTRYDKFCGRSSVSEYVNPRSSSHSSRISSQSSSQQACEYTNQTLFGNNPQEVSQSLLRYSTQRSFNPKIYDVNAEFIAHRPCYKSSTLPGSPQKQVDETFGLGVTDLFDTGSMNHDLHVCALPISYPDMRAPGFTNPRTNLLAENNLPILPPLERGKEREVFATINSPRSASPYNKSDPPCAVHAERRPFLETCDTLHSRRLSQAQSEDESLHWEDLMNCDDNLSDHEHREGRLSIKKANAELFDIAETLHNLHFEKSTSINEDACPATRGYITMSIRTQGDNASSLSKSRIIEAGGNDGSAQSSTEPSNSFEDPWDDRLFPQSEEGQRRILLDPPSPTAESHTLFNSKRHSPLCVATKSLGSNKDCQGSLVQLHVDMAMTDFEHEIPSSQGSDSEETVDTSNEVAQGTYPLRRQRKNRSYQRELNLMSVDSGCGSFDGPNLHIGQFLADHLSDNPLSVEEGSQWTSRECSSSIIIKVEDENVDPQIRREQAILWQLLQNEARAGGSEQAKINKIHKDFDKETKLAVWEALKKEERMRGGSEVTLGIDSNVDMEEDSGDDMEFEEEKGIGILPEAPCER